VTALAAWLEHHTLRAPADLRARVVAYALAVPSPEPLPTALASAAREALARVVAHPGDRSVALDLLAADALITLALLAQAQHDPTELSAFAISVLQAVRNDA
jgi:hypothetical protein